MMTTLPNSKPTSAEDHVMFPDVRDLLTMLHLSEPRPVRIFVKRLSFASFALSHQSDIHPEPTVAISRTPSLGSMTPAHTSAPTYAHELGASLVVVGADAAFITSAEQARRLPQVPLAHPPTRSALRWSSPVSARPAETNLVSSPFSDTRSNAVESRTCTCLVRE